MGPKSSNYCFLLIMVLFNIEYAIGQSKPLKEANFERGQILEIRLVDGRTIFMQFRNNIDNGIRGILVNAYKKQYIVTDKFIEINYDEIVSCRKISKGISKKAIIGFIALVAVTLYMLWIQDWTSINLE